MHPLQTLVLVHEVLSKGNMGNITATMPINISIKPRVFKNIHIGVSCSPEGTRIYTELFKEFYDVFAWLYEEMPGIDLAIVVHEIPTYPNAKPIHQWLHPMHPRKAIVIRGEVEKLLNLVLFTLSH